MNKKELVLLPKFRAVLQVAPALDEARATSRVQARLVGIGLERSCGRCGGSGRHSFCQAHGDTCFGCSGAGRVAQSLTAALLADATSRVAEGRLTEYFAKLKRTRDAAALRAKSFDYIRLDLRMTYEDNRPDNSPWTRFVVDAEVRHGKLVTAFEAALLTLESRKTAAPDAEVSAVTAAFDALVRNFRQTKVDAAARPEFCAARVGNPQYWVEFLPKSFVVREFSVTGHPMTGYAVKSVDYVAGALSVDDLLRCLCNQHAACCRRCEIVSTLA